MKKNLYTVLHIEDNCIEHINSFSNKAKATAHFKHMLKEKFPQLVPNEIKEAIESGILITYKGDTYNFIVQNQP